MSPVLTFKTRAMKSCEVACPGVVASSIPSVESSISVDAFIFFSVFFGKSGSRRGNSPAIEHSSDPNELASNDWKSCIENADDSDDDVEGDGALSSEGDTLSGNGA